MKIERNLSNVERVTRLLLGLCLMGLAFSSSNINGIEWFTVIIATALLFNGIFSRCYLWFVLDIDTYKPRSGKCQQVKLR